MARIVKKKKRRLNFLGIAVVLFTVSILSWLISSLLINTINASLSMKIQEMSDEIQVLKTQNQSLNYEIQTLVNKDRIYEVAQINDLNQIADNIISVGE